MGQFLSLRVSFTRLRFVFVHLGKSSIIFCRFVVAAGFSFKFTDPRAYLGVCEGALGHGPSSGHSIINFTFRIKVVNIFK